MFEDYYGMSPEEADLLQSLLSGEQSLPTTQPVQTEPYYPPLDLGNWNPSMINIDRLNLLGDPGPAYDPNSIYYFHTGTDVGVPNASGGFDYRGAHPIQYQTGQTYRMFDKKGNVVGTASSPAEMQALVEQSKKLPYYTMELVGNQYGQTLPSGGWLPRKTDAGSFGSMIVPMLSIAGLAAGLGALTGGIGTAGATAGAATGGAGAGTAAGTTAATAAGTGAAAGGLGAIAPALGEIVVTAAPTAGILSAPTIAALSGITAGGLAASGLLSPPATPTATPAEPAPQDIVVTAPTAPAPAIPPVVPPLLPSTSPVAPVEPAPQDIVVEAPKPVQDVTLPPPPITSVDIPSGAGTTLPEVPQQQSLLNEIMKYYSLGSGVLDALGIGQGSGTTTATPYTSALGALPTFGRGQFTPFQGNYETYGQGPEWNFFGGQ